jgi:uncharacterized membrane protein
MIFPISKLYQTVMIMETKSITKKLKDFTFQPEKQNISSSQRVLSVIGGAYMLWSAISSITSKKKTGIVGPMWNAVSGGYLVYRGITGHCALKDSLQGSQNKIISYLHKN